MGQVIQLSNELAVKAKAAKYAKQLSQEENTLLLDIANNEECSREDRLVAYQFLYQTAENQWHAIKQIAENYKQRWMKLQHETVVKRHEDSLVHDIMNIDISADDLVKVLQMMAEKGKR